MKKVILIACLLLVTLLTYAQDYPFVDKRLKLLTIQELMSKPSPTDALPVYFEDGTKTTFSAIMPKIMSEELEPLMYVDDKGDFKVMVVKKKKKTSNKKGKNNVPDEFKDQKNKLSSSPVGYFVKSAVVFDAYTIYGTKNVPDVKLKHVAQVAAQWLDNDQDGKIDDINLLNTLKKTKPVILMSDKGFGNRQYSELFSAFPDSELQDLSAEETNNPRRRDASQEEVHHLIMNAGFVKMLPKVFSHQRNVGSTLFKIWKYANDNGLYAYDDETCDDGCKTIEFVYLASAAYLDSQADLFSDEMRVKTRRALQEKLPEIIKLFESDQYVYPIHMWPNGNYKYQQNIKYSGIK